MASVFNKGEKVRLKTNIKELIVFSVWPGNFYVCIWFDENNEFHRSVVHGSELELIELTSTNCF
jgi:hypothetical protein